MITLNVNGRAHKLEVSPEMPLLWVLRDHLSLTGAKYGCGIAQCGACTVHIDGEAARSCSIMAGDAVGRREFRTPRQSSWRLDDRARVDGQGDQWPGTGPSSVDARGRHQGRILPADGSALCQGRHRSQWPDRGLATQAEGAVKVDRIVAPVDCGVAINPDIITAQVEGAVGFALSAALRNQITLKNGSVEQNNFDDYEPTRMREMPKVEVHIVRSMEPPSGIGEPGVPPVVPAIGNAIFAATGKRLRSLPFDLKSLV